MSPVPYPCKSCKTTVGANHERIFCNYCHDWIHLKCTNLSLADYQRFSQNDKPWMFYFCSIEGLAFNTLDPDVFASVFTEADSSQVPNLLSVDDAGSDPHPIQYVIDPNDHSHNANSCNYFTEASFNATLSSLQRRHLLDGDLLGST